MTEAIITSLEQAGEGSLADLIDRLTLYEHREGYDGKDWEKIASEAAEAIRALAASTPVGGLGSSADADTHRAAAGAVLVLKRMLGEVESFPRAPDDARIWIGGWSTYSGQPDPSLVHVGEVRAAIGAADGCSSNEGAGQ